MRTPSPSRLVSVLPLVAAAALAATPLAACSEDVPDPVAPGGDAGDGAALPPLGDPAVPCAAALDAVYAAPGAFDAVEKGGILACSRGEPLTKEALATKLTGLGWTGRPPTSGAQVFRVLYRTERGDAKPSAGYSSALVLVPDAPKVASLPVVVVSRGTRGQGVACASSKPDELADNADLETMLYPLVAQGYALIAPDLAGYAGYGAPGNPPPAYAQAADVGKSTLDGARALKKLFPGLGDKTVLVGHSQGGHTALSALAMGGAYAPDVNVAGVATYAPLWLSQRSWGATLQRSAAQLLGVTIKSSPLIAAISVWYHYTQAELLDGPGEGKKLFAADKQAAIEDFVKSECIADAYPKLEALGTYIDQLFDPAFVSSVATAAAGYGQCGTDAVCTKWLARYTADRPKLEGAAKAVPHYLAYGGQDTTIAPGRMKCALDRLVPEQANLTVCFEPSAKHGSIVGVAGDRIVDFVGQVNHGGPAPGACPGNASAIAESCATPPPND